MSFRSSMVPLALAALLSCAPPGAVGVAPTSGVAAGGAPVGGASDPAPATAASRGPDAILERADLRAYHGWIRYLSFRAEHADERFGKGSERARHDQEELASWTARILAKPDLLAGLRGVIEWAYVSPVDGSGQPFKLNIPIDYDPARPTPLALYMHGYSGNHLEHATDMKDRSGDFELAVLGRSRGGRYRALSEADVLGALEYVQAHWTIDPDRVHLKGGSMGGGATFWLGSRYPQRFASGRPVCGFASDLPIGNLLSFPIYATHSADDFVVPVLHSRGPIARLRELGGNATLDETTGLGHAAWNYKEGNERGDAWYVQQVRPASSSVKRLDFTALDGQAARAYWAEISEWGPKPEPAHFALTLTDKNRLSARLDNVTRLTLRVSEAPIDRAAALEVSVGGARLLRKAPLPEALTLAKQNGTWTFEVEPPSLPFRLHTPGGANQLFNGEPLLIVYGTGGSPDARAAMRMAAVAASRSANAAWPSPNGELGDDGISHNQNLYGDLRIEADTDVSDEEIATHHLVLIGSAAENAIVARMADRLPVRYEDGELRFSDGTKESAADTVIGLVHYDPLAPSRLIFWVASSDPSAYRADALAPRLLGAAPTGVDLVVTRASTPTLLMARSFDSRWGWLSREAVPSLSPAGADAVAFGRMLAESVRRAASADFALALEGRQSGPLFAPGVRLTDVTALFYYEPIGVMTLTGAELAQARLTLEGKLQGGIQPEPTRKLDPKRSYRLAMTAGQIWPFVGATHLAPQQYVLTDLELASALRRSGFVRP
jgi:poly(3-hydroxybutyrate) depolymerase